MRGLKRADKTEGLSPDEKAVHWLVRHDMGDMSPAEQAQFQAWLEQSPRHADLFAEARRSWEVCDGGEDSRQLRAMREAALALGPERRRAGWLPVAASVASLLIGGAIMWGARDYWQAPAEPPAALDRLGAADYVTARGERLDLSLPDGTAVTLNTRSALDVAYDGGLRLVRLVEGQAFFEVTQDRARPFVVQAGGRRITALGTAFDVSVLDGKVAVLLVEGRISVTQDTDGGPDRTGGPAVPVLMAPGQELVVTQGVVRRHDDVDVDRAIRWRDGFVEFQNDTLADAVAELNRYAPFQMTIDDQRVAALRVSGVFRTDRPDNFMEAIGAVFPLVMERRSPSEVRILWAGQRAG